MRRIYISPECLLVLDLMLVLVLFSRVALDSLGMKWKRRREREREEKRLQFETADRFLEALGALSPCCQIKKKRGNYPPDSLNPIYLYYLRV